MGQKTRSIQKIRPYKKLLLKPWILPADGSYHYEEEGWKEQNKRLHHEMVDLANKLNIYTNPSMIPVWLLRMQNFIKSNLPIYKKRLRSNAEIKELLKSFHG